MDILIYAKPEKVEHKMVEHVFIGYCFWTGKRPALTKLDSIKKVYFSDGEKIYAEGEFLLSETTFEDISKGICFSPLKRVNKKQPKKPPTRGWCYINKEGLKCYKP